MTDTILRSETTSIADIVDVQRYPLSDPQYRAKLIADAQESLANMSCVTLPGFLRPGVSDLMAAEASAALPLAYRRDKQYSAYSNQGNSSEVRQRLFWNKQFVTPTDTLPAAGLINTLYAWDDLTSFVRDVMQESELYPLSDDLMRCVTTIMGDGDQHGWHYDKNDFVVSLLLQKPDEGGEFEFAPYVRTDKDENEEEVARVFDGVSNLSRCHSVEPGTLMIFCGRLSVHRVRAVSGARRRIIALFSYDRSPGVVCTPETRLRAVGRVQ